MSKQDARKLDHKTLEAIRIRAVRQVQSGQSPETVIQALGFSRRCLYSWLARYRAGGWDALKAKPIAGRPKKLTARQIQWLDDAVTMKNPLQCKLPFALWTRGQIRTLLYRQYRIKLSLTSLGGLLGQRGLTCQKPLFRAWQQNPSLVQRWLEQEYPTIRSLASRAGVEIFFEDESGVRADFPRGTTWAPRGNTPLPRVTGERFRLNMISAISPRGNLRFMVVRGGVGARIFIGFLKRLMQGRRRPVLLIVEGHPAHRAKIVRTYVEALGGKLRLFYLPRTRPNLTPTSWSGMT